MNFGGVALLAALATVGCGSSESTQATPTATATAAVTAMPHPTATATASAASSASAPPDTSVADGEKAAADLHRHHRHHSHGGVAMFIHMAIDTLGVSADKKAQLEKIQSDLHAKMAPSRDASRALLTLLADGVAAGKVDKGKVDAALAKEEAAAKETHAATQDALNQLHAALTPAEREALVEKVKAHVEVWRKTVEAEHGSKEKGSHLARITEDLSLTPDQVEKISAALKKDAPAKPDLGAIDNHMKAFEAAFVQDKFDAKTLAATSNAANVSIAKHGGARLARFYEIVAPLLTPEQRTKLAAEIRERMTDKHAAK